MAIPTSLLPGTHNATGGVDNGPVAIFVKGVPHVVSGAPLSAVTGDQEEGMLQPLPQGPDVRGVGGSGDGPSHRIAVFALGAGGDALVEVAHYLVDQPVPGHDGPEARRSRGWRS